MTKQQLKQDLTCIKHLSSEIHKRPSLTEYTSHGYDHSMRMERMCKDLLSSSIRNKKLQLTDCEKFILGSAIYIHDIGMQMTKAEILNVFAGHFDELAHNLGISSSCLASDLDILSMDKEERFTFVRRYHNFLSAFWIEAEVGAIDLDEDEKALLLSGCHAYPDHCDRILAHYIACVVAAHGFDFMSQYTFDDNNPLNFKGQNIRMQLLCVLLSLVDSMDCDRRRVDESFYYLNDICDESRSHWQKHFYTTGVKIDSGLIHITYTFPSQLNDYERSVYREYFSHQTRCWIEYNLKRYQDILSRNDLLLQIRESFSYLPVVQALSDNMFSRMEEAIADWIESESPIAPDKINVGICIRGNDVLMVRRKNPEGKLCWQFPSGRHKQNISDEERLLNHIEEETGIKCDMVQRLSKRRQPDTGRICTYWIVNYSSGEVVNGDPKENDAVEWVPVSEYRQRITSNLQLKVKAFLDTLAPDVDRREDTDCISVGIVAHEGKVLLVKRRKPEDKLIWSFPSGHIKLGETSGEAAVREVFEETCIRTHTVEYLGRRIHKDTDRDLCYWVCGYDSGEPDCSKDENTVEAVWVDISTLHDLIKSDIFDKAEQYLSSQTIPRH